MTNKTIKAFFTITLQNKKEFLQKTDENTNN
jgi:hypothetical protein